MPAADPTSSDLRFTFDASRLNVWFLEPAFVSPDRTAQHDAGFGVAQIDPRWSTIFFWRRLTVRQATALAIA